MEINSSVIVFVRNKIILWQFTLSCKRNSLFICLNDDILRTFFVLYTILKVRFLAKIIVFYCNILDIKVCKATKGM